MKNHWFPWKIMKNHIWRENFNLNTRVSNFSNQFSSKNHQKSSIFIEKTWKIMDFHEKLWQIIFDVKKSIYIPACRFFVIHFHRKIIKIMNFHQKMMVNPTWKSRLGYLNLSVALKKNMKYYRKKYEKKTSIFYTFTEYLWSENNFIFSILEQYNFTFTEYLRRKKERKMMHFFPGELAGLAGLGWA